MYIPYTPWDCPIDPNEGQWMQMAYMERLGIPIYLTSGAPAVLSLAQHPRPRRPKSSSPSPTRPSSTDKA